MPTVILILSLVGMAFAFLYGNTRKELEMLRPIEREEDETTNRPIVDAHPLLKV